METPLEGIMEKNPTTVVRLATDPASVVVGFGDRDFDMAGLDLVRVVVAGDRESCVCR